MGCGAKRTFHLQHFATSFANGLDRSWTVRYVNAKENRNWTGSPMGCGAKRTFHLQKFATSFANELDRFLTVRSVNAKIIGIEEAPPWAAVQNEHSTYIFLLLVLQMNWIAF